MKEKLISKDMIRGVHPIFRGRFGNVLTKIVFSVGGLNKVNAIYDASKQYTGLAFVNDMLDKLQIIRKAENYEVLDNFKEGSFITVSNHPYGHVDGIIAISLVAGKRRDYKMMVNWMLSQIDTMDEHFIGVNPYSKDNKMSELKSSIGGVKQCLEHIRDGHPLGLFPAGGVSSPHLDRTEDREWQEPVLKLIKKAKVPVIPMFISGNNSWFYRFLGFIDWRIRTVRLLHEVHNKKGKTITVRFGNPISVEEQSKYTDIKEFGEFLKAQTYAMKKKPNR
ncbi:putative hemolysin [Dysgonomonas sp. PFB1-18]|uniref:lysophospholipid acyltransferase family protein n=1 Tax=unclassified Dysgonomonas TaxID=2630389 RepID=UPI0024734AAA|nr:MULTISPECIES: lysophospholipid acyltransferase family protein [unclassified Dysgonomonas]MDH6307503.1 putative hemolysin [Dysgonomonas sp. PF1-14]MDH6337421.1 putative hemolysin [Dysgonomonas sp. PF1-16]MDH6379345.1 putative hemolysin [Dysgonomonas sp. PFB1-18]MDH6396017.1 putative hemolysin [Dysgonomonas sp. PF1-23]